MRAMVALAKNGKGRPLSLMEISKREHISRPYLERLFARLKSDGLVKSSKGAAGGYLLAKPAEKINVFEIVEALEGPLAVFYCMSGEQKKITCSSGRCLTKKVWHELQRNIIGTLRKFTLKDLI